MTAGQTEMLADVSRRIFGGIPYTFHRAEGFYPLLLGSDDEARANALYNPGTLKVVNSLTDEIVWNTEL